MFCRVSMLERGIEQNNLVNQRQRAAATRLAHSRWHWITLAVAHC